MSEPITGLQALVFGALDSGISSATRVPGYPITSIMNLMIGSGVDARWSINEKVALEAALGASATGRHSLVTVKHVGMNMLADPLITSATHTIGAGLVILTGDDPGVKQSQNEQDSRYYGLHCIFAGTDAKIFAITNVNKTAVISINLFLFNLLPPLPSVILRNT